MESNLKAIRYYDNKAISRKGFGFTLAEILIVLTIIGVMAVMTIPSLIQNSGSQQKIALFKKAFNVVSNAYATEFATKTPPANGSFANRDIVFDGLARQLNIKYYYDYLTHKKEYSEPSKSSYRNNRYIMVTEDGIGYSVDGCGGSGNISVKPKTTVNSLKKDYVGICEETGIVVGVLLEPTKAEASLDETLICKNDVDIDNINCSEVVFYVTKQGITSGNPDCTISGRIISGVNPRPSSCDEE